MNIRVVSKALSWGLHVQEHFTPSLGSSVWASGVFLTSLTCCFGGGCRVKLQLYPWLHGVTALKNK